MNTKKVITIVSFVVVMVLLLVGCALTNKIAKSGGTVWGVGAFDSNGERIYFTATSDRGTEITYTGGPSSNGWLLGGGGLLAGASCHGPVGGGGVHRLGWWQRRD